MLTRPSASSYFQRYAGGDSNDKSPIRANEPTTSAALQSATNRNKFGGQRVDSDDHPVHPGCFSRATAVDGSRFFSFPQDPNRGPKKETRAARDYMETTTTCGISTQEVIKAQQFRNISRTELDETVKINLLLRMMGTGFFATFRQLCVFDVLLAGLWFFSNRYVNVSHGLQVPKRLTAALLAGLSLMVCHTAIAVLQPALVQHRPFVFDSFKGSASHRTSFQKLILKYFQFPWSRWIQIGHTRARAIIFGIWILLRARVAVACFVLLTSVVGVSPGFTSLAKIAIFLATLLDSVGIIYHGDLEIQWGSAKSLVPNEQQQSGILKNSFIYSRNNGVLGPNRFNLACARGIVIYIATTIVAVVWKLASRRLPSFETNLILWGPAKKIGSLTLLVLLDTPGFYAHQSMSMTVSGGGIIYKVGCIIGALWRICLGEALVVVAIGVAALLTGVAHQQYSALMTSRLVECDIPTLSCLLSGSPSPNSAQIGKKSALVAVHQSLRDPAIQLPPNLSAKHFAVSPPPDKETPLYLARTRPEFENRNTITWKGNLLRKISCCLPLSDEMRDALHVLCLGAVPHSHVALFLARLLKPEYFIPLWPREARLVNAGCDWAPLVTVCTVSLTQSLLPFKSRPQENFAMSFLGRKLVLEGDQGFLVVADSLHRDIKCTISLAMCWEAVAGAERCEFNFKSPSGNAFDAQKYSTARSSPTTPARRGTTSTYQTLEAAQRFHGQTFVYRCPADLETALESVGMADQIWHADKDGGSIRFAAGSLAFPAAERMELLFTLETQIADLVRILPLAVAGFVKLLHVRESFAHCRDQWKQSAVVEVSQTMNDPVTHRTNKFFPSLQKRGGPLNYGSFASTDYSADSLGYGSDDLSCARRIVASAIVLLVVTKVLVEAPKQPSHNSITSNTAKLLVALERDLEPALAVLNDFTNGSANSLALQALEQAYCKPQSLWSHSSQLRRLLAQI